MIHGFYVPNDRKSRRRFAVLIVGFLALITIAFAVLGALGYFLLKKIFGI